MSETPETDKNTPTLQEGGESAKSEKQPGGFFRRLFKRSKSVVPAIVDASLGDQAIDQRMIGEEPPEAPATPPLPRPKKRVEKREPSQPAQKAPAVAESSGAPAAEKPVIDPKFEEVRPMALDQYEPTSTPEDAQTSRGRLRTWLASLHPGQKALLFSTIFVFVAMLFFGSVLFIRFLATRPGPPPPPTPMSNLDPTIPIPVSVVLPDGQEFKLIQGGFVDEEWNPQGAEWLVDTEVPRWLSLPWSAEMEAAVGAFEPNAPIQLVMDNDDILVYRFQSLEEIPLDELKQYHVNTADLLIRLYRPRKSTTLVLIAIP